MSDKKEFHFWVLSEYEEEQNYLCDMAKKGYLFEKVTLPGIYHFKKKEPTSMIYRIDFNPQRKKDRSSYLRMFEDFGWEYIQDLNEFSYFCKPEDGTNDDIFSNNESRIEMLERIYRRKMIVLLCLCFVIPQGMHMIVEGRVTGPASVVFCAVWIVVAFLYIAIITRCAAGFIKLRRKYGVK